MVTAVVQYPTEEQIVVLNKEVLRMIKVRKADAHRVIKPLAIKPAID
ncbi:MAG: hypothetical protein HY619_05790, partial [Thaumarchaeota archaeon]|nr:hypothetical protein [Nitrososphaerota archaeon]